MPRTSKHASSEGALAACPRRDLERLGLEELRSVWRARYGPPPPIRSAELLRLSLAWREQAALEGGLSAETRRELKAFGRKVPSEVLPVGARVAREWLGERHEVEVTRDGYVWRGQTFASLSAVARHITGTRWNGPRFFGLRASSAVS
jgi:hypothetical protein